MTLRSSRLDLTNAWQHCFPKELKCLHDALWIISSRALKEEVDHPRSHFLPAALDLLHNRVWTANERRRQGPTLKGWPGNPREVAGIQFHEGVPHARSHGEGYLRMLLPPL